MPEVLDDDDIVALGEGQVVVKDDVLGPQAAEVAAALSAWARPRMRAAGIAGGEVRADVRGDHLAWLDDAPAAAAAFLAWREAVRVRLYEGAWLRLDAGETQVACYLPGRGYTRHVDAPRGSTARRVTAIVYLNEGWRPEDGGALVAHLDAGEQRVMPSLGRAALFLSDRVEHEVLPARRERWAVTTWLRAAT